MNDLEFVETPDLICELMRRCDCGYIILSSNQTASQDHLRSGRRGSPAELIGLLELGKHGIIHDMEQSVHTKGEKLINLCDDPTCPCHDEDDEITEFEEDDDETT